MLRDLLTKLDYWIAPITGVGLNPGASLQRTRDFVSRNWCVFQD